MLPREALVWVLSALTQAFRIPFDEKLVTGQMPPPYGVNSIVLAADLLGLRAAWAKRPASALRKLVAPFLVLLSPVLREPHNGLVAGRESLASLDSAAPNQRLAFLLRVEGDCVALFEQGQASHTILPFSEFEPSYVGQVLLAAPKEKPLADPDAHGLAVVDNIDINGRLITRGTGIADGLNRDKNDRRKDKDGDDDDND